MHKQLLPLAGIFLLILAQSAAGQVGTGGVPALQQPNSVDCSDPLLANSADCQSEGATGQNIQSPAAQQQQPTPSGALSGNTIYNQQQNQELHPPTFNDNGGTNAEAENRARGRLEKLPPQPLTEFQKFVAGTTGEVLPVFGASLFQNAPSTFAPLDQAPVPPDYVIGPGDELRIRVWGQVNFNADVRVDRAGEVYLPQVGQVHVAGLPYQLLNGHLHDAIARVYRNFDLTADLGQIRAVQVYIVGQAHRPGTYTISSLSTLVDALFASGGPSVLGSLRHIYLKRDGKNVADVDLYDLLIDGDKSHDAKLQSGDVIFIPAAGPQVALTGSVRRPGIYELRSDTTLGDVIEYAGGRSAVAGGSHISIERIEDRRDRQAMEVANDAQGLATPLRDGDILRVLSIVPMYQKTVTLRGNTANPGRFAWHAGMRISELIPDKESLLTRNYWWRRTQLGLPAPQFEPVPMLAAQSQPTNPVDLRERAQNFATGLPICLYSAENNCIPYDPNIPGQYYQFVQQLQQQQVQRQLQQNQQSPEQQSQQNPQSPQSSQQYQPFLLDQGGNFNLGTDQPDGASQLGEQQGTTSSLAQRQYQVNTENTAGAVQKTTVRLVAPEIDWDYAVIERLDPDTLKTSLIPFDLGKLVMQHDQSQDLLLEPGDVVSIFSQADIHVPIAQQTKLVQLEGEFVHAGTYSVQPGETLRQLIERAGGLTGDAYLYASQFTRESTRVLQQQRIDQYVQELQLEITRGTLAQSSSALNTTQDVSSANAAVASSRELVFRLQQIRATGRVVINLTAASTGAAAVPDLTLEDGDRFIVPPVPATVNVVGSVYNQNSFLYVSGRRVADYLALAGGPNRDADKKQIYIIRADGSVVSRAGNSGLWGNNFYALTLNPGDTVVVSEKTFRPTALRAFLEWSQLFSQLALGAAAISIIQ